MLALEAVLDIGYHCAFPQKTFPYPPVREVLFSPKCMYISLDTICESAIRSWDSALAF